MGCSFSCSSSSTFKTIRVVHLNGYVEDFYYPVTVGEVTGKTPRHFVCTPAQLVSGGSKPLKPGAQLEPGHVYFFLPYSTIQSDVSPLDLASLARKLTRIAKTSQSQANSPLRNSVSGSSPVWSSRARSPNRFSGQSVGVKPERNVVAPGLPRSTKAHLWKPILDTIRERSFNRRSESDLQEKAFGDTKIG